MTCMFSIEELLPTYDEAYDAIARMYERMIFEDIAQFNGVERVTATGCVLWVIDGGRA